jgi:serine/threonine protein kinase
MFVDEAKIAVQLTHSNIAQIHDLGCHEGAYYMAVEYVHGRDLRAISNAEQARGGAVPIALACFIVMKVAEALDYAHRAEGRDGRPLNVIHRDVSPQNVLISFEGDVKVIDFGLAKAAGRSTQTQAGILKGKLAYLSPEQARGEVIDQRSDIYALGIVFFELLTGQRLFLRDNDIDTIMAVREGRVPAPRSVASDIPFELEAIVQRALDSDRTTRFQRAQELHDAVEAFLYRSGKVVTRRHVASYMRELFPEGLMQPDEVEEMLGVELLDDQDDIEEIIEEPSGLIDADSFEEETLDVPGDSLPPPRTTWDSTKEVDVGAMRDSEPPPTRHGLAVPRGPRESSSRMASARPEGHAADNPLLRTTTRSEDPSLTHATAQHRLAEDDADLYTIDEPIDAVLPLPASTTANVHIDDEGPSTVVAQTNERDTWPAPAASGAHPTRSLDEMIAELPDFADEQDDSDSTAVTSWSSDETTKPIDSDPDDPAVHPSRGPGRRRVR